MSHAANILRVEHERITARQAELDTEREELRERLRRNTEARALAAGQLVELKKSRDALSAPKFAVATSEAAQSASTAVRETLKTLLPEE